MLPLAIEFICAQQNKPRNLDISVSGYRKGWRMISSFFTQKIGYILAIFHRFITDLAHHHRHALKRIFTEKYYFPPIKLNILRNFNVHSCEYNLKKVGSFFLYRHNGVLFNFKTLLSKEEKRNQKSKYDKIHTNYSFNIGVIFVSQKILFLLYLNIKDIQ